MNKPHRLEERTDYDDSSVNMDLKWEEGKHRDGTGHGDGHGDMMMMVMMMMRLMWIVNTIEVGYFPMCTLAVSLQLLRMLRIKHWEG